MSFKIAVASTDEINVDAHFGGASSFLIYTVEQDGSYQFEEKRVVTEKDSEPEAGCQSEGCGSGCNQPKEGGGCGGNHTDATLDAKISLVEDCRCLLCLKIGPKVERQLERKAITAFQINYKIEDALKKIIEYYTKLDNHISLRKARGNS